MSCLQCMLTVFIGHQISIPLCNNFLGDLLDKQTPTFLGLITSVRNWIGVVIHRALFLPLIFSDVPHCRRRCALRPSAASGLLFSTLMHCLYIAIHRASTRCRRRAAQLQWSLLVKDVRQRGHATPSIPAFLRTLTPNSCPHQNMEMAYNMICHFGCTKLVVPLICSAHFSQVHYIIHVCSSDMLACGTNHLYISLIFFRN